VLKLNPQLVYGRMTGWGQSGPLAGKAGHDLVYLAITGALHAMGTKEKPTIPLNLIGDFGGGAMYLALGLLSALHHARATGTGQVVDAAMSDGVISLMGMIYGDFADGRWVDERESNPIDGGAPFYNVYRCRDGKWLAIAAIEPQFYRNLLQALIDDGVALPLRLPQMLAAQWQRSTWPVQQEAFAAIFMQRTRDQWCELLAAHDACVAPVLSLAEAPGFSHNRERQSFIEVQGVVQPAPAPRLSVTAGFVNNPPTGKTVDIAVALGAWSS
jgi:alpha-methylacyl-CoA racemase